MLQHLPGSRRDTVDQILIHDVRLPRCSQSVSISPEVFIHNTHIVDANMPDLKGDFNLVNIILNGIKVYS